VCNKSANSFLQITNFLFDADVSTLDLIALNLQRGRDHGLKPYVYYREICRVDGRRRASNFDDLSSNMSREVMRSWRWRVGFMLGRSRNICNSNNDSNSRPHFIIYQCAISGCYRY
jgi:hypothetical protein